MRGCSGFRSTASTGSERTDRPGAVVVAAGADGGGAAMVTNGLDLVFVPEPATLVLALVAVLAWHLKRGRSAEESRQLNNA